MNKTTLITIKIIKIIHVIDVECVKALYKAPIPIIGANNTILSNIITSIWTCVISFVVRVINEAVENLLNSVFEKLSTFLKTAFLKSLATPAPTRDDRNAELIAAIEPIKAIPNIIKPDLSI